LAPRFAHVALTISKIIQVIPPRWVFLAGLLLISASLPLSIIGMSFGQFMLAWGWIFASDFKGRIRGLLNNPLALILASVYLLHVVFLINSTDLDWALKDLRVKLPLLIMPVFLSSGPPIKRSELIWVLRIFLAAVVSASLISSYLALFKGYSEASQLSPFISHIRYSLLVCLAIAFLIVISLRKGLSPKSILLQLGLAAWLFVFLFILKAFTGILIFALLMWLACLYPIFRAKERRKKLAWASGFLLLGLLYLLSLNYLKDEYFSVPEIDSSRLEAYSAEGNPYSHDLQNTQSIRGNRVWLYVSDLELKRVWEQRSTIPYDSLCGNNQVLRDILIRYLSSKDLRKDGAALASLSDEEIESIEQGQAFYQRGPLGPIAERISDAGWSWEQYRSRNDATGNSVIQRVELWKTGLYLFGKSFWTGVGTGDVKRDFASALNERQSSLADSPLRTHNQWITFGISFGIFGLLWIIFSFAAPFRLKGAGRSPMYVIFLMVVVLSMMAEDTLETSAGACMFALFNSLLLFYPSIDPHVEQEETA
jgi:hypothetical protein